MAFYPYQDVDAYSHQSIEIKMGGKLITAVKDIKYSDNLERGKLMGTSPLKIAKTMGEYSAEGSIEMAKLDAMEFKAMLGPAFYRKTFTITNTLSELGLPTIIDTLRGCSLKKNQGGTSSGNDAAMITFDLDVWYILWGGINPIFNINGG